MTDDYYHFDDRQMIMIGEHTNRQFRIGDEVKVRVANVVIEESSVDFEIVGMVKQFAGRTRKAAPKVIHAGRKGEGGSGRGERRGKKDEGGSARGNRRGKGSDEKKAHAVAMAAAK